VSVEYNMGGVGPITVQKGSVNFWRMKVVADLLEGYWFSAHEQWKVMEMPYYDVELVK